MKHSLYEIAQQYHTLSEQCEGEEYDPVALADTLESLEGDLETKAITIAKAIKNLEAFAKDIRQAELGMANRRRGLESKADHLRHYILDSLKLANLSKIEDVYFSICVRKNAPHVVIDDYEILPESYMVFSATPNKESIQSAIKDGHIVPGAHLECSERVDIR